MSLKAKKSLGQNFLKDEKILKAISDSIDTSSNDLIIEIGPGLGALTKYLSQKSSYLLCYEIDERMKEYLSSYESEKCQIIYADFLQRDIKKDIIKKFDTINVIANIPYYITTPIIEHLLKSIEFNQMTLLIQKEVADRFLAQPKTKDYGYFTVYLNHYFYMKKLFDVLPSAFVPAPKVMSSVVFFQKKEFIENVSMEFQDFLKQAFSQKRKTLKNNLKSYPKEFIHDAFLHLHFKDTIRAEEVSYEEFVKLYEIISKK